MHNNDYYKKITVAEGEEIVEVIRQHWIAKIGALCAATLFVLLPFFFMFYLFGLGAIGVTLFVTLIIFGLIFCAREYYMWKYNVFVITNKKVIDIDQRGLFHKVVSEVAFPKVLDVSYQSKGIINAVFGFGDITVKTSIPDLALAIRHVAQVKKRTALLIEAISDGGGMKQRSEVTSAQKRENFQDFLQQEAFEEYEHVPLKELIETYTDTYSVNSLKRLIAQALERGNESDPVDSEG